jgi:hypothetical protein
MQPTPKASAGGYDAAVSTEFAVRFALGAARAGGSADFVVPAHPLRENRVSTPARDDCALGASIEAASNPISSIAPPDISPAPPPQRRLIARR